MQGRKTPNVEVGGAIRNSKSFIFQVVLSLISLFRAVFFVVFLLVFTKCSVDSVLLLRAFFVSRFCLVPF